MSSFEPIAIIGQGCALPGALNPAELWQATSAGADLTSSAKDSDWGIEKQRVMAVTGDTTDRTWSDRGGYVRGFEQVFDPSQYKLAPELVASLDPGVQWCLHAARQALISAGLEPFAGQRTDCGVILGNLAYAPRSMQDYTARYWLSEQRAVFGDHNPADLAGLPDTPANRMLSAATPAQATARALGASGSAYCLDAACASSLYAIKLACDQLQDGHANLMLAGALNHADDLYLHVGFTALQALSRNGIARPFDRRADGLVPGAGAAVLVLKRLRDARRDGDRILGVIRGIGLSNDGRAGGFLAPSWEGQARAMQQAWNQCDLDPRQLSYLECHATGTAAGDATELRSIKQVFGDNRDVALASLKGNIGHLITAAGAAGLVRLLGAMEAGQLSRSINVDERIAGLDDGPLRLLTENEAWPDKQARIAAVNAFGFGGNNAHMIVQHELDAKQWPVASDLSKPAPAAAQVEPIVIVGVEVSSGNSRGRQEFLQRLLEPASAPQAMDQLDIPVHELGFPPMDLDQTIGQQLLVMQLIRDLTASAKALNHQSTAVLVGMSTDPETTRYATRTRLAQWVDGWREADFDCSENWLEAASDALTEGLTAAGVLGTMPNIPANRSNHQLDLCGPSHTVAAGELGGIYCLQIAQRSLQQGDIDAAIVAASDLCHSPIYRQALSELRGENQSAAGDAGVALLLKRESDALRDGDRIVARLGHGDDASQAYRWQPAQSEYVQQRFGYCHAAAGLLDIAAAALMLQHRLCFDRNSGQLVPDLATDPAHWALRIDAIDACGGEDWHQHIVLQAPDQSAALMPGNSAQLHRFAANSPDQLRATLQDEQRSESGEYRLAIIAADQAEYEHRKAIALARLQKLADGDQPGVLRLSEGVYLATAPVAGEMGFVFTGAASAYPGMGRELLMALPDAASEALNRFPVLKTTQDWLDADMPAPESPFAVLQGCTLLSQVHARISQDLLKLRPQAMLGVSSGETNSMYAAGAWRDMDDMFAEIDASGMYQTWIAGDFQAAKEAWQSDRTIDWQAYRVIAPAELLSELLNDEPHVFLTMINAGRDCVVAGEAAALAALIPEINRLATAVVPLGHDIIAHCPVLRSWEAPWRTIHDRDTQAVPGVRFYSNASGGSYSAERNAIADALTDQATNAVDFRRVVESAYADGVRIFVEHGPRQLCSQWVSDILGERPHLSVHLDRPGAGLSPLFEAVAQLWCAGADVDCTALETALPPAPQPVVEASDAIRVSLHPPVMQWPDIDQDNGKMPAAPGLPPVSAAPADDPLTLRALRAALSTAPKPSYASPRETPRPRAPIAAPRELVEITSSENVAVATVPHTAVSTLAVQSQEAASATVRKLHAQMAMTHQSYMSLQNRAMDQLVAARAHFAAHGELTAPSPPPIEQTSAPAVSRRAPPPVVATPMVAAPVVASAVPAAEVTRVSPPTAPAPDTTEKATSPARFPGPKFDRAQLEILAGGRISDVLGPLFKQQDDFRRQVRMPCPPLLLADRVLGIDATPGAMENTGSIWTETDVDADDWYLHHGHMPAGIMIESGQADLLLISWMGADFENRGNRVYRLLGCELTYRAGLPAIGDTLRYDIHVDGYAKQGDVRLFFFHYNCEVDGDRRLEVRHGQAGFFTDEELANSAGVIWQAEKESPRADLSVDPAPCPTRKQSFDRADIEAFADGDLVSCFGPGFEAAWCHQRTPTIAAGKLLLFDRVTRLEHAGGPWQRGYISAELDILPDHWFFEGHFKNDPCMPGTLMFEGGIQVMAFYLASLGFTLPRDGWRFEPVKDEAFQLQCRSQLVPGARKLVCELYVHGVEGGTTPRLRADMMCSVDGRKAFHGQCIGLELVPAWPLESRQRLLPTTASVDVAKEGDFAFDERSMVACAWGRPSDAFGPHYRQFDGARRGPRLPGYPYHFISRILSVNVPPRAMEAGGKVVVEYDVPRDAWYFEENSQATMPFPVLLEAALQPCGWLATYIGGGFNGDEELFFRNLDGTASWHADVHPDAGTLRTEASNNSVSKVGSMTIVSFTVRCSQGEKLIYEMDTVFGFFPGAALAEQAGLNPSEEELAELQAPGNVLRPLRRQDAAIFGGTLRLPGPMLCLLDRITGLWPDGGAANAGRVRAEMDVDPQAWYFKSHFYGDPVQPGSLGLEMMMQCLQYFAIDRDLGADMRGPRFEALDTPHSWTYRGQVLPHNRVVCCDLSISRIERVDGRIVLTANASLWADGTKIYGAEQLGLAISEGAPAEHHAADLVLDSRVDQWVADHCPTWTVPALPMTCMADLLAGAAAKRVPGKIVTGLAQVRASRWLNFDKASRHLKTWVKPASASRAEASLLAWEADSASYQPVAEGTVLFAEQYAFAPKPWPALAGEPNKTLPYATGSLFHGPAFQALRQLTLSSEGSSALVDAGHPGVPQGQINPGFLDACLHGIPHDDLRRWFPELDDGLAAYPLLILGAAFYGPAPTGGIHRVEARPRGMHPQWRLPQIALQIIDEHDDLWAELTLLEALLPKGPLGALPPSERRAFITGHSDQTARLSSTDGETSTLSIAEMTASNWLPGTLEHIYQCREQDPRLLTREILIKEHIASQHRQHPARVAVTTTSDGVQARVADNLLVAQAVELVETQDDRLTVSSEPATYDLGPVRDYWREQLGNDGGLEEDLFLALASRFVASVQCPDSDLVNPADHRGVLYVANHQVGVESMLFSILLGGLRRQKIVTLAKQEHRDSWIGRLLQVFFAHRQNAPDLLLLADRDDPRDVLMKMTQALASVAAGESSLLVHAAGTRSLQAAEPVETVSTALIGAAVAAGVDIVPVAFCAGLPAEPLAERLEFPAGYGRQHIVLGKRLASTELAQLTALKQKETVLQALNPLVTDASRARPDSPDPEFALEVDTRLNTRNVHLVQAVLALSLKYSHLPLSEQGQQVLNAVESGPNGDNALEKDSWLARASAEIFGR